MKSMKLRRRSVTMMLRVSARERPVTRRRMLPVGSIIEYWLLATHAEYPGAGSSSTVYWAPGMPSRLRQTRGSEPVAFHLLLTGAGTPALGGGTAVHFV
jgi:hypothetical protein